MADYTPPAPPEHLTDRSKELWRRLTTVRARTPERIELIRVALEDLDRADALRTRLDDLHGIPAAYEQLLAYHRMEHLVRLRIIRAWDLLGLTWSPEEDGRKW